MTHATEHLLRRRGRERRDPRFGLRRTSSFLASDNPIDTNVVWMTGDRAGIVSFSATVERTAAGSNGIIFEFGGTARGIAAWVDGADVSFCAGGDGTDGISLTISGALAVGQRAKFVFSCSAEDGRGWVFMDGILREFGRCVDLTFDGGWAGVADGAIGTVDGTANGYVPAPQAVALVNASIIGTVDCFLRQLPKGVHYG